MLFKLLILFLLLIYFKVFIFKEKLKTKEVALYVIAINENIYIIYTFFKPVQIFGPPFYIKRKLFFFSNINFDFSW